MSSKDGDTLVRFLKSKQPEPENPALERTTIIVPIVGNDSDLRLLKLVEKISRHSDAHITLLYVVEVMQSMPLDAELPAEVEKGEIVLNHARDAVERSLENKTSTVDTEIIQARAAGAAIVDEAIERDANAIMMSAMIQRRHGRLTTGETVDYVLRNAPCEVMVLRQPMPSWLLDSLEMDIE